MHPKKEDKQVKIIFLPSAGKNFLHIPDERKEKANVVKPYTQNIPHAVVIAQARRADAIIRIPAPDNPPRGERDPQKGCCLV
jgi:hypothetical protein